MNGCRCFCATIGHERRHQQRRSPLGLFPDQPTPRLYDCIVEILRVHHYSTRTEQAYVHWIRRYIEFHDHQHPRQLVEDDVNRFLTHLAVQEHVAASTQNQALSAVLFLYQHVLPLTGGFYGNINSRFLRQRERTSRPMPYEL
jgi:hypothetical protein